MTKLCPRGKAAAKRKFKVYPSAYANAYASKICAGKIKDPSGTKRKDWGPKRKKDGGEIKAKKRDDAKVKRPNYSGKAPVRFDYTESGAKRPVKKADGGEIKIQKVAKALHKASGLHKQQAKTLDSIKKADGGMIDMTKMKYV
jgi:hypothetical protein